MKEKEGGLQKLNSAVEAGERLYPDTSSPGRESIRKDLRHMKEQWDHLVAGLNDSQRHLDACVSQWESYTECHQQLQQWMVDVQRTVNLGAEMKNTLPEKRTQLQNCKSLLQDVVAHQRVVDSMVQKAQGLQSAEVGKLVQEAKSQYEALVHMVKVRGGETYANQK